MKNCESKHTINKKNVIMFLCSFVSITRVFNSFRSCEKKLQISSDVFGSHRNIFDNVRESSEVTATFSETEKSRVENLTHLTQEKLAGM